MDRNDLNSFESQDDQDDNDTDYSSSPISLQKNVGPREMNNDTDLQKLRTAFLDTDYNSDPTEMEYKGAFYTPTLSSDIRRFQTDKGLEVDGILNPKGPTISALNKHLLETQKADQRYGTVRLSQAVAFGKKNDAKDLTKVMSGFERLGRYKNPFKNEQDAYFEYNFDKAFREYQGNKGLKVDGVLKPGGETVNALNADLRKQGEGMEIPAENQKQISTKKRIWANGEESLYPPGSPHYFLEKVAQYNKRYPNVRDTPPLKALNTPFIDIAGNAKNPVLNSGGVAINVVGNILDGVRNALLLEQIYKDIKK